MSLNHEALLAAVLGMVAIVVLLLAGIGAAVVARAVLHACDELRVQRAWRRTTRSVPIDIEAGLAAIADAVHGAPQPGTDDWLYDRYPEAPSWEDTP